MSCSDAYEPYVDPFSNRRDRMVKVLAETPLAAFTADFFPDIQYIYNYQWTYQLEQALNRLEKKLGLPPL